MTSHQPSSPNPQEQEPKPPFPAQHQPYPGLESEMQPQPDFGEHSYRSCNRLVGKAAIITGGDSAIGRAVALAFAREGADVLIAYLNADADAQETVRLIAQTGRKVIAVRGDIGEAAHCQHLVEQALQGFGHLDILVNNAAFQMTHRSLHELSSAELDHTFRTNVYAMFYLCQAGLPHLRAGGAIINTTSIQVYQPKPSLLAYAATKGAIVTFTKGLAAEAIQQGIRVNAVAPGPVWTPLIPATMPEEQVSQFGQNTPIGRPAQPAELAPLYVFLASQEASYIAGEVVGVTGGQPLV